MYPGIDRWYLEKVLPGLRSSERLAYLAFENECPVASAVLKLGEHAKFCHVRVAKDFQDASLGQMIFTQMAFHARHVKGVEDIHFTLPESLWSEKAEFFRSFGFEAAVKAARQYRAGEDELFCSAETSTVWNHAVKRLYLLDRFAPGGYTISDKLLLSVSHKYAERIFEGKKRIEIRKKFSKRWRGRQAVIYSTQPVSALMGEVTIAGVDPGSPSEIWERFGENVGCSLEEFQEYVGTASEIYAIELINISPYISPVGISQISHLINQDLRPPQSFLQVKVNSNDPWSKAISVASLMHSMYPSSKPATMRSARR